MNIPYQTNGRFIPYHSNVGQRRKEAKQYSDFNKRRNQVATYPPKFNVDDVPTPTKFTLETLILFGVLITAIFIAAILLFEILLTFRAPLPPLFPCAIERITVFTRA